MHLLSHTKWENKYSEEIGDGVKDDEESIEEWSSSHTTPVLA